MAELAVRLGSVVSYHRSGTVLFADGMDNGFAPYIETTVGVGSSVEVVTTPTFQGGLAAKLTAASDVTQTTGLLKRIQPIVLGKVGLEITFSCESLNNSFIISIQLNTGVLREFWGILFITDSDEIHYRPPSGTWTKFADYTLNTDDPYVFYVAKLVVDLVNKKYIKLYINQTTIDMSDLLPYTPADATYQRLEFVTGLKGKLTENNVVYLDNFIITTDEP